MGVERTPPAFASISLGKKALEILRWFVFVPGAFAAATAVNEVFPFQPISVTAMGAFFSNAAAVTVGGLIAPRGKLMAGMVVATLIFAIQALKVSVLMMKQHNDSAFFEHSFGFLGIAVGVVLLRRLAKP